MNFFNKHGIEVNDYVIVDEDKLLQELNESSDLLLNLINQNNKILDSNFNITTNIIDSQIKTEEIDYSSL